MAQRNDNADLAVRILQDIRQELRSMRLGQEELRAEMRDGFGKVSARLENLRDLAGDRWRDHERRIRALERRRAA